MHFLSKQTSCIKLEQPIEALDAIRAEVRQIVEPEISGERFAPHSGHRSGYRHLIKQQENTTESGNQTSLASSVWLKKTTSQSYSLWILDFRKKKP